MVINITGNHISLTLSLFMRKKIKKKDNQLQFSNVKFKFKTKYMNENNNRHVFYEQNLIIERFFSVFSNLIEKIF